MTGKGSISILIVEDDEAVRELLAGSLGLEGYNIATAVSVEETVEELCQKDFRLVSLDGEFPGGGGAHVARMLREQYPQIKILSIAGAMQSYGDMNFQKPFDLAEIAEAVTHLLSE